jgi:hypothetical protein
MGLINVNPDAEVKSAFDVVQAGTYRVRIKEVEDRNPKNNDLKVTFNFVDAPAMVTNVQNEPCKNLGQLFDYVMLASDKQWKLRSLVEACGMVWQNLDEQDLVGRELDVTVKVEDYQGDKVNKVGRYIAPKV